MFQVKWDGVLKLNWVKYQHVEILGDAITDEMSDSESLDDAWDLRLEESSDEDLNIDTLIEIQVGTKKPRLFLFAILFFLMFALVF